MSQPKKKIDVFSSDFEVGAPIGSIGVDGFAGLSELKADVAEDEKRAQRAQLIEAVRGGKHIALNVKANTFRQQEGKANLKFVRLGGDIAAQAKTFKGQPFIMDHQTYSHDSRRGTILSSVAVNETATRIAFLQELEVVKPDGVISVLDGTLDRFSISWRPEPGAPIMCSIHNVNVLSRESCSCWPGDVVDMSGGKKKQAEFIYMGWTGKETSGTNFPAVGTTNIEEIRSALAAELNLPPREKGRSMKNWQRLAAALGLSALTEDDEDTALAALGTMNRRIATAEQERDAARTSLATAQTQLEAARAGLAAASSTRVDELISGAIREGKIRTQRDKDGNIVLSAREARLRRIAKEPNGVAQITAELAEMDVIVPVGKRPVVELTGEPPATDPLVGVDEALAAEMENVAAQLGLKVEDMNNFRSNLRHTEG